jgi:RsmE family RNA methyltransferase
MNLILLSPSDLDGNRLARIKDSRRLRHLREVHGARPGDRVTVGVEGGGIGRGEILSLDDEEARFTLDDLEETPPPGLPVHLVMALPRPRMLARSLEHVTALGVKRLTLLHSRRVEKSYWQSPELAPEKIHAHLVLGLEQARDTAMPEVDLAKGFRPFMEERLPELLEGRRGLLAHPGLGVECPRGLTQPALLMVGPEGGFIPWEVERMLDAGCTGIHLGSRILRVETAMIALLARLF